MAIEYQRAPTKSPLAWAPRHNLHTFDTEASPLFAPSRKVKAAALLPHSCRCARRRQRYCRPGSQLPGTSQLPGASIAIFFILRTIRGSARFPVRRGTSQGPIAVPRCAPRPSQRQRQAARLVQHAPVFAATPTIRIVVLNMPTTGCHIMRLSRALIRCQFLLPSRHGISPHPPSPTFPSRSCPALASAMFHP